MWSPARHSFSKLRVQVLKWAFPQDSRAECGLPDPLTGDLSYSSPERPFVPTLERNIFLLKESAIALAEEGESYGGLDGGMWFRKFSAFGPQDQSDKSARWVSLG